MLRTALTGAWLGTVAAIGGLSSLLDAQPAHEHGGQEAAPGSSEWRMPPMDGGMPMLPGLEGSLPPARPFLPGAETSLSALPSAEPSRVVELADGDTIDLTAGLVRREIHGRAYKLWAYNRQYPGPLLRVEEDATVVVRFRNEIELPTTIHWHGVRVDNAFDGVPGVTQEPVAPGEAFVYRVRFEDSGIYWYHPHIRTAVQVDAGLYGNILVRPPARDAYAPVNREEVLVLDDILIDEHGLFPWGGDGGPSHALMGRFGNVFLVNGDPAYTLDVRPGSVIRFFITNVANSRTFHVRFDGAPVKVVGADLSRFEREQWVDGVVLGAAQRYTVEAAFEAPGEYAITNSIQAIDHFRGEFHPQVDTLGIVRVRGARVEEDHLTAFRELRENGRVAAEIDGLRSSFDREADRELELTLEVRGLPVPVMRAMELDTLYFPPVEFNDAMPMMNWLSTAGQVRWILRDRRTGHENMDILWRFEQGDVVKVRVVNSVDSFHPMNHPIHLHGQRFLVLDRDGVRNGNLAWKDTVILPVGSTYDLLVQMTNPGDWLLHCHIAEHVEAGMKLLFRVEPTRQAARGDGAPADTRQLRSRTRAAAVGRKALSR